MKATIAFGLILLGLVLLMVSSLWSTLFPPTNVWTDEKAERAATVKARLSNLGPLVNGPPRSMHRGPDPATLKQEFDALAAEERQLNAEFVAAAESPQRASAVLKWTGITLAALGIIGWYVVKNES